MNLWRLMVVAAISPFLQTPQSDRVGTASIEGTVVRAGTNDAIAGVDLELTPAPTNSADSAGPPAGAPPPPVAPFSVKSGNDGKFAFRNLPAGSYKLVGARIGGGWVPIEYGQRGVLDRGVFFPIGEGESKRDMRLEMIPVGSISGRVIDENNKAVGRVAVVALNRMYREDRSVLNLVQIVNTDENGEYRLFSLVPGTYYVAIRPEDPSRRTSTWSVFPPGRRGPSEQASSPVVTKRILPTGETLEETFRFVYFGGTTDPARAVPLNLPPGGNLGAVDIPYAAGRMKNLHIRGKVIDGTTGNPAAGAAVRLVPRIFSSHLIVPTTTTNAAGEFDLTGAVAGSYQLYFLGAQVPPRPAAPGTPPPPPPPPLVAMVPIELAEKDVENITVTINLGSTINGRISIDGQEAIGDPGFSRMRVMIEPVPSGIAMGQVQTVTPSADGSVKIENVWPGTFRILMSSSPPNTYVKSMTLGFTDLLNQPIAVPLQTAGTLDIVLGTDTAGVSGRVTTERQEPASNVKVALVPNAPLRGRGDLYKSVTTDAAGSFSISSVAPGDYRIFAWEDVEDGAWRDPEFLRLDETRGRALRVDARKSQSVAITAIPKRQN
jgi:protocatechuate 3,4-dioxygenase beta subunit